MNSVYFNASADVHEQLRIRIPFAPKLPRSKVFYSADSISNRADSTDHVVILPVSLFFFLQ